MISYFYGDDDRFKQSKSEVMGRHAFLSYIMFLVHAESGELHQ